MRFNAFEIVLAVVCSTFHVSDTAILHQHFRNWEKTNNILSKADYLSELNNQNNFHKVEETFRENGDNQGVKEHINKTYVSENNVKHGSNAEVDSSHKEYGVAFHTYGSKIEKGISEREYDIDELSIEEDIEQRFKKLVGAEDLSISSKMRSKRYKPSRYIKELFKAMLENDAHSPHATEPGTKIPVPTIRSYRGVRGTVIYSLF